MADYSEFPTTPTAWQEQALRDLTATDPPAVAIPAAGPAPLRRRPDLTALVPGLVFVLIALLGLTGADLPLGIFEDGGVLWVVLIGAGIALLVSEVRRARRRR
ncbi:hypothetical protein [Trujillonella endophytica]|uniref:Uncharacterized protein n=1 Tax=Trujillonella endophytica TaxID=673521 RepID=A0A1H8RQD7_9ACTN|nr:hypothetical protein [Trujillella endophytica]SEO68507.1 hypothetical protein SAMN05660991_01261 [Trujillella endophytica]